jgi:hypothetical protein
MRVKPDRGLRRMLSLLNIVSADESSLNRVRQSGPADWRPEFRLSGRRGSLAVGALGNRRESLGVTSKNKRLHPDRTGNRLAIIAIPPPQLRCRASGKYARRRSEVRAIQQAALFRSAFVPTARLMLPVSASLAQRWGL